MVLKDFMAIAGSPGLYKFIAQGKNAVIVEHLETGKRSSAHGADKVSALEDIAVFTEAGEVSLAAVFDKIYEKEDGASSIDYKSSAEDLKSYFGDILPDYDRERVYVSDIKKIIQWYNILHYLDMLEKEKEETEKSADNDEADTPAGDKTDTDAGKTGPAEDGGKTGNSEKAENSEQADDGGKDND